MRINNLLGRATLFSLTLCAFQVFSSLANGSIISYTDVSGANVTYSNIQENPTRLSIPVSADSAPVFGKPTGGDSLLFPDLAFKASSVGGGFDLADSKFSTTIKTNSSTKGITKVTLSEIGDYSLIRTVLNSTPSVEAKAIGWLSIEAINGSPITPIVIPSVSGAQFDNVFQLSANQSKLTGAPWAGTLNFDVIAAMQQHGLQGLVTQASLSLGNSLLATSDANSAGNIQKTYVSITTLTQDVPEPSTLTLLGLGCLGLVLYFRKK